MGSDWAQQFREKAEESEGRYSPPEDFNDVVESTEEEEETQLEEPEAEVEEAEAEKEPVKPVVVDVEKRTAEMMDRMIGEKAPAKRSGGGNPEGAMMAAMMGLLVLQSLPTIFNTVQSAFQPMTPGGGSSPQNYYPVQCSLCGWKGFGISGMVCPRCGRS